MARKLFEAMVNNQASRLALAPPTKDNQLNRLTEEDLAPEMALLDDLPAASRTQAAPATTDPRTALQNGHSWRRISDLVGVPQVRQELGGLVLQVAELKRQNRPLGKAANIVLAGPTGSGRGELARLYAQALAELDLVSVGHLVHARLSQQLAPQWPGQARSLVEMTVQEAVGGTLLIEWDVPPGSDDGQIDVAEALAGALRGGREVPVFALVGEPDSLNKIFVAVPALAQCYGHIWTLPDYTAAELGEIAVRYLVRRGHELPDDVRAAVAGMAGRLTDRTVRGAHAMAAALARTAASRTLTIADLGYAQPGPAPARTGGGLASVG